MWGKGFGHWLLIDEEMWHLGYGLKFCHTKGQRGIASNSYRPNRICLGLFDVCWAFGLVFDMMVA